MLSTTISNFNSAIFQFRRRSDEQERAGENKRRRDSDKHRRKSAGREREAAAAEEANYPCGEADRREVLHQGHLFWVR